MYIRRLNVDISVNGRTIFLRQCRDFVRKRRAISNLINREIVAQKNERKRQNYRREYKFHSHQICRAFSFAFLISLILIYSSSNASLSRKALRIKLEY